MEGSTKRLRGEDKNLGKRKRGETASVRQTGEISGEKRQVELSRVELVLQKNRTGYVTGASLYFVE